MFFWNVAALKRQLASGALPPRAGLRYTIAGLISLSVLWEIGWRTATPAMAVDNVAAVANLAVLVFGTLVVYAANGGDRGTDFLGRFLSLSWVVGVRIFVGLIAAIFVAGIVAELRAPGSLDAPGSIEHMSAILVVLFNAFFYWRLAVHIRQVAFAQASNDSAMPMAAS